MQHPLGRCDRCGERLFAHVDVGRICHNCGACEESDERGDSGGVDANGTDDDEDGGGRVRPPAPCQ